MNRLADLLSQAALQYRDRTALVCGDRRLTFGETEALSNWIAAVLAKRGVAKGDRVAIWLPNCPEYVCTDFALIKAGLVRVPLNPRLAPTEVEYILRDCRPRALVTSSVFAGTVGVGNQGLFAGTVGVGNQGLFAGTVGVGNQGLFAGTVDAPIVEHVLYTENLCPKDQQFPRTSPPPPTESTPQFPKTAPYTATPTTDDDPYMILYTSGTTGRPKGAVTTLRSRWVTLFHTYANELFVTPNDVMLHAASLAHGSGTKVLPFFLKGATNVLMERFDPGEFCRLVEQERVTATWLVPTAIGLLLDSPERTRYDLRTLQTVIYAGAPMPAERLRQALAAFGPIFVQVYGLSEAPQPDLVLPKADHTPDSSRLACAGRPALGVQVRVVTPEGGDVEPGSDAIGEIWVRGEHIMAGYWEQPEATAEVLDRDGWLHTGDLARVDADGYIYIVDRSKDLIISGGYNIYPREVEEALYRHPAVREAAVIGVPDPVWGEAVKAYVALKPDHDTSAEELIAHCAGLLAGYKKPRSVDFLPDLPKSPTGKILKKELRAPYWAGRDRQVN